MNSSSRPWRATPTDENLARRLAGALDLPPLMAAALTHRGVHSVEEANAFLKPSVEALCDPFALADMEPAAERVARAILGGEPLLVYGDADVDGLSGTGLLVQVFRAFGADPAVFVPNRAFEGYSFTDRGVAAVLAQGAKVVVSVDHGISTIEPIAALQAAGVDVIVTDHHMPHARLPPALAVVNPRREDCGYPFKNLAGVGVAFKLACALASRLQQLRPRPAEVFHRALGEALAWVCLGTVADVMPLCGENRVLVSRGLRALALSSAPGLRALCAVAGLKADQPIRTEDIAFRLAPRINSAARLGRADIAVELMITQDAARAEVLATTLDELNRARQQAERRLLDELEPLLQDAPAGEPLFLASDRWGTGLLGLVAGRLARRLGRPAVLMSSAVGEPAKGSVRSVPGFHAQRALRDCAPFLESHGGHAMAAGFQIRTPQIPAFRSAFLDAWRQQCTGGEGLPPLEYEGELPLAALTHGLMRRLEELEPHGEGNPRPLLAVSGVVVDSVRPLGDDGQHLELRVSQGGEQRRVVAFGRSDLASVLLPGTAADLLFLPRLNRFRGNTSVELELVEVRCGGRPADR